MEQLTLEDKNKAFNKLSRKDKRLAILKDALLITTNVEGFSLTHGIYGTFYGLNRTLSLQENFLQSNSISCNVCAKGIMFCSRVRLGNVFDITVSIKEEEVIDSLKGIFREYELDCLENLFENGYITKDINSLTMKIYNVLNEKYPNQMGDTGFLTAVYVDQYYPTSSRERFIKALKNIIWAEGDFNKGIFRYILLKD